MKKSREEIFPLIAEINEELALPLNFIEKIIGILYNGSIQIC